MLSNKHQFKIVVLCWKPINGRGAGPRSYKHRTH